MKRLSHAILLSLSLLLLSCAGEAAKCGDGAIQGNEQCDDGNTASGDGCASDCLSDESCGNGIVDINEACDDGNTIDDDECPNTCLLPNDESTGCSCSAAGGTSRGTTLPFIFMLALGLFLLRSRVTN